MGSFELYREAKEGGFRGGDLEMLQASGLQQLWAEKNAAGQDETDESKTEERARGWLLETGGWFRENILEHRDELGQQSRKAYFLELFDRDPEAAVAELDKLFNSLAH